MFPRAKDTKQNNTGVHFVGVSHFYDSVHADTVSDANKNTRA